MIPDDEQPTIWDYALGLLGAAIFIGILYLAWVYAAWCQC